MSKDLDIVQLATITLEFNTAAEPVIDELGLATKWKESITKIGGAENKLGAVKDFSGNLFSAGKRFFNTATNATGFKTGLVALTKLSAEEIFSTNILMEKANEIRIEAAQTYIAQTNEAIGRVLETPEISEANIATVAATMPESGKTKEAIQAYEMIGAKSLVKIAKFEPKMS